MTAVKKEAPIDADTAYKLAAAALRAEIASSNVPIEGEILPVEGVIHVALSGEPISRDLMDALLRSSKIDIPELRQPRKKLA